MAAEDRSIVFLGTPAAAATVLEHLLDEGFPIVHVVTQPDAKRGRGSATSPSPVKAVALARGLDVSHDLEWIKQHSSQNVLGVVVAYGRIIPTSVLNVVPMINIHFSLLPRWRGAAPVERAILAGDDKTGVCIMDIEPTLDTGAVYARQEVPITVSSTATSLTSELAEAGAHLLVRTLRQGLGTPVAQSGDVTHAAKISREELKIDWSQSADSVHRQVRALRAYTEVDGIRVKVLDAQLGPSDVELSIGEFNRDAVVGTGVGTVVLRQVQPEGKSAMAAESWLRGRPSSATARFT
jgi:methionyl-tRNA formyltransferase